jgi:hypothetical protein
LKIKLKGRDFDRGEVTLTEHDFQDALQKNGRGTGNGAYARRGLLRVWWWPVGPKLIFDQIAAPVQEIMDDFLYMVWERCTIVDWGTMLQARRSRFRFSMRLLDFSFGLMFLATLWRWSRSSP